MEARVIIVSAKKSNRSENTVWAVAITGEKEPKAHCKSAYKAMRFAFLLKARTGLNISENCLSRLVFEMSEYKQQLNLDIASKRLMEAEDAKLDAMIEAVAAEQREEKKARKPRNPRAKKNTVSAK